MAHCGLVCGERRRNAGGVLWVGTIRREKFLFLPPEQLKFPTCTLHKRARDRMRLGASTNTTVTGETRKRQWDSSHAEQQPPATRIARSARRHARCGTRPNAERFGGRAGSHAHHPLPCPAVCGRHSLGAPSPGYSPPPRAPEAGRARSPRSRHVARPVVPEHAVSDSSRPGLPCGRGPHLCVRPRRRLHGCVAQ